MKWILSLTLAISLAANAWSALYLMDAGVAQTQADISLKRNRAALMQCIAVTNEFLATGASRDALIAKAKAVSGEYPAFSNDGHYWIGPLGMSFDEEGKLLSVAEWDTVYEQVTRNAK